MPKPTLTAAAEAAEIRTPADRRGKGDRLPCFPRPLIRILIRPSFRSLPAYVVDASPGGLGLLLDCPLKRGFVLALQLPGGPDGQNHVAGARVVHCTDCGNGRWLVGCRLSQRLTPEDLSGLHVVDQPPGADPLPAS